MAGFTDSNNQNLIRTNVWSRQLKELLLDDLNAMKFVRILSDFPDGYTIKSFKLVVLKSLYMREPPKTSCTYCKNQEGKDSTVSGQSAGKELNCKTLIWHGLEVYGMAKAV